MQMQVNFRRERSEQHRAHLFFVRLAPILFLKLCFLLIYLLSCVKAICKPCVLYRNSCLRWGVFQYLLSKIIQDEHCPIDSATYIFFSSQEIQFFRDVVYSLHTQYYMRTRYLKKDVALSEPYLKVCHMLKHVMTKIS